MTDSSRKITDPTFRFYIDRGGTFTDVYAEVSGEHRFRVIKLLSEDPQNYSDAPREGCLLYTSPSPRDLSTSRMPSSA